MCDLSDIGEWTTVTHHMLAGTKNIANSRRRKGERLLIEIWVCAVQVFDIFVCRPRSSWSITLAFAPDVQANKQIACLILSYQSQLGSSNLLTPTWEFGQVAKFPECLYPSQKLRSPPTSAFWQQASAGHRIDHQRLGSAWMASGLAMTEVCLTDHLGSSMLPGNNKRQWWLVTNYRVTKKNAAMQSTHNHDVQAWLSYTEVAVNQPQLKLHLYSTT